jgi:hypothetical protein
MQFTSSGIFQESNSPGIQRAGAYHRQSGKALQGRGGRLDFERRKGFGTAETKLPNPRSDWITRRRCHMW